MWSQSIEVLNPYEALMASKPIVDTIPKRNVFRTFWTYITKHNK